MRYYPIYLDIKDKPCVVIGGGEVAERKVISLLNAGARVRVIGPEVTDILERMAEEKKITLSKRRYRKGDLMGALLAFAATDNEEINREVSLEARERGVLLNVVDDPDKCGFIVPSVVERGRLSIAISTSGASPAFAKKVRMELEERYGDEYAVFLEIMAAVRQKLLTKGGEGDKNRKIFNKLASSPIPDMIRNGRWEEVDQTMVSLLGEGYSLASLGLQKIEG
jgi:precorrin-2 dehydrogenase/sirohydrochlorin ferrochelatase